MWFVVFSSFFLFSIIIIIMIIYLNLFYVLFIIFMILWIPDCQLQSVLKSRICSQCCVCFCVNNSEVSPFPYYCLLEKTWFLQVSMFWYLCVLFVQSTLIKMEGVKWNFNYQYSVVTQLHGKKTPAFSTGRY